MDGSRRVARKGQTRPHKRNHQKEGGGGKGTENGFSEKAIYRAKQTPLFQAEEAETRPGNDEKREVETKRPMSNRPEEFEEGPERTEAHDLGGGQKTAKEAH